MLDIAYRNSGDATLDLIAKQATRYTYYYTARMAIPNGGEGKLFIVPDEDADVEITGLVGSVVGLSDKHGRRLPNNLGNNLNTLWPMPGQAQNNGSFAEKGLIVSIYEAKKGLQLTDAYPDKQVAFPIETSDNGIAPHAGPYSQVASRWLDVKDFLHPGYRMGAFVEPQPFKYYLLSAGKLVFHFLNLDTALSNNAGDPPTSIPTFHTVTLQFVGRKCNVEVK
jgi:hypothetical protein